MTAMDIARTFAAHGQVADAQRAYTLALHQGDGSDPAGELEGALYLLQSGGDYKIAYTALQTLYSRGQLRDEALDVMTQAFYAPNEKLMKTRYEKNCKLLAKYPYLFRKDFPAFGDLPIRFYPFDDNGYLPFTIEGGSFAPYFNPKEQKITRNFFHDLEQPILAENVFSQYELEYLNDMVRKSEWVARDNHIYLHYTDWGTFCAYLQVLNLRSLLEEKKFVFLIEEEISQYPINFKARFGLDYSQYKVKPVGIREVNKLIWHTQLSSHNGGDFFNEIFFGHPNLVAYESLIFDNVQETMADLRKHLATAAQQGKGLVLTGGDTGLRFDQRLFRELSNLHNPTDKDLFVAYFLGNLDFNQGLDRSARIAPTIFFQPHFYSLDYQIRAGQDGRAMLLCEEYKEIHKSQIFQGFKYIKTFTPMRRPTTSYGATVKFMAEQAPVDVREDGQAQTKWMDDALIGKVLNRSFMIDWQDRLYKDSVLVRFEDGKLNPTATFTALAAFLDIPYTHSMTYCSGVSGINPESLKGNALGFDPSRIYCTYDEYVDDYERCFLEYFLRDAYEYYGYNLHYYDGGSVDENEVTGWINAFATQDEWIKKSVRTAVAFQMEMENANEEERARVSDRVARMSVANYHKNRLEIAKVLMEGLNFVNENGQPLRMMPKLELDPALLEAPLYH